MKFALTEFRKTGFLDSRPVCSTDTGSFYTVCRTTLSEVAVVVVGGGGFGVCVCVWWWWWGGGGVILTQF